MGFALQCGKSYIGGLASTDVPSKVQGFYLLEPRAEVGLIECYMLPSLPQADRRQIRFSPLRP
jgi:hypothetical protein